MRATILKAPLSFDMVDLEPPEPGPGQVLLKVSAVSVCGSDINAFRGVHPRIKAPTLLGHELAGEVVACGEGVGTSLLGRRVCAEPNVCCGHCRFCLRGLPNICPEYRVLGESMDLPGGFAEYVCVAADQVFELPENLPLELGSLVQPLAICYEGMAHRAQVSAGEKVLVIGAGPIGLGCLMLSRLVDAEVMAVDVVPHRIQLARRLGAEHVLDARDDVRAAVLDWTDGHGVDVAVEAVGGDQTHSMQLAQAATAPRGRIVVLGAFTNKTFPFPVGDLKNKEQSLLGSHGHPQAFRPVLDLVSAGSLDPATLVSHRGGLEDTQTFFELLDQRVDGVMKVLVRPNLQS